MEKIDILLATYNGEKYLKEQIDSILAQTYANFNLIISDDCSSDNTVKILKEYEKKDNRIKVYIQQKNIGITKNFEFLLEKVESQIYMLSDQDDVWNQDKIEKSYNKLIETNSDLVFSDLKVVDENLNIMNKSMWSKLKVDKKIKKYLGYQMLYLNNCVTGCTIISRSSFLKEILPFELNTKYLIHDYYIALVISFKGKIAYVDEPLMLYRQTGNNAVGTHKKSLKLEKFKDVRNLFIDVKVEHFEVFCKKQELFTDDQRKLNDESLKYFYRLRDVKYINLKKLGLFYKLYRYEAPSYFIMNFIFLNIPILGKVIFNFNKKIKIVK